MIPALVESDDVQESPFGHYEEAAIVALLIDFPELYVSMSRFLVPEIFSRPEVQYIIASIKQDFEKYTVVPTRQLLHDRLAKSLTVEDPYEDILSIVKTESNPREIPMLRKTLRSWAEHKTYDLLYTDEAIAAHNSGDYGHLQKIVDDASRITSVGKQGFWLFDQLDELFVDNAIEHISTGFPKLDRHLNDGGPSPQEVVVWLASTGVGKSLMLCNNTKTALEAGHDVMYVTFELSELITAARISSIISQQELNRFMKSGLDDLKQSERDAVDSCRSAVKSRVTDFKRYGSSLCIYELPPDECSVNDIYALIDNNRKMKGWSPKVVIIDYLELMVSRHSYGNDSGDYTRQKSIATEVRGLARNENVLVYTATQGNRASVTAANRDSGDGGPMNLNLDKAAESFGKAMPVDYVVSLNQLESEYRPEHGPSIIRLWIAKNRNGPKFETVETNVHYGRMTIAEPT